MPKQILRINDFSGGLNSSLDPRDIDDKQVAKAENVRLNHRGRVSVLGSEGLHEADTDINNYPVGIAGEGLIHFKSDRHGAGWGGDILHQHGYNNFEDGSHWTESGYFSITSTGMPFSTSGSHAGSYFQQTAEFFDPKHPIGGWIYEFEYELMDLSSSDAQQISQFYIKGGLAFFAENDVPLTKSNGNNRVRFQANINQSFIENSIFRVVVDVTGAVNFTIKQVSCKAVDLPIGNASYFLWRAYRTHMPDQIWEKNNIDETVSDTNSIYKSFLNANPWGARVHSLAVESGLAHYYIDGGLRLSDSQLQKAVRSPQYFKYADTRLKLDSGVFFTPNGWETGNVHTGTPKLFWLQNAETSYGSPVSLTLSKGQDEFQTSFNNVLASSDEGLDGGPGLFEHVLVKPGEELDVDKLAAAGFRNIHRIQITFNDENEFEFSGADTNMPDETFTFAGVQDQFADNNDHTSETALTSNQGDHVMQRNPWLYELDGDESYNTNPAWVYVAIGKAVGNSEDTQGHFVEDSLNSEQGGAESAAQCTAENGNFLYYPVDSPNGLWDGWIGIVEGPHRQVDIRIDPSTGSGTGNIEKWILNETGQEVSDEDFETSWDDGHTHGQFEHDFVGIAMFGASYTMGQVPFLYDFYHTISVQSITISDSPMMTNLDHLFGRGSNGEELAPESRQYAGSEVAVLQTKWSTSSHASGWQGLDGGHWWSFGITAVYEGGSEGRITGHQIADPGEGFMKWAGYSPEAGGNGEEVPTIELAFLDPSCSEYDPRQIGWRLYAKDSGPAATSDDWFLQCEVDLKTNMLTSELTGYTTEGNSSFGVPGNDARTNYKYVLYIIDINNNLSPALARTHREMSGISASETSIQSSFKTATVLNRRVWIGNFKTVDRHGLEYDTHYPDAMIGSQVNSFDIFPTQKLDEVSIKDGDEIVKLENYYDKLLQFKTKKLHILDMSDPDITTLERTELHKGLLFKSNSCETEFGIAWINNHGVYLYDGEKIVDLTQNEGQQLLKIKSTGLYDSWEDFTLGEELSLDNLKYCQVGYDIINRQLLITGWGRYKENDTYYNTANSVYIFDFVTRAWTTGKNVLTDGNRTNIVNDDEGKLVWIADPFNNNPTSAKTWSSGTDTTDYFVLRTKDYSFGDVGVKKKIYSVNISYKGDASQLNLKYAVNGETDFDDMYQFKNPDSGSGDDTPLANKTDLESWHTVKLVPTTASQANNIYSFAIELNGTAGADFELNDINIVYRKKNIV